MFSCQAASFRHLPLGLEFKAPLHPCQTGTLSTKSLGLAWFGDVRGCPGLFIYRVWVCLSAPGIVKRPGPFFVDRCWQQEFNLSASKPLSSLERLKQSFFFWPSLARQTFCNRFLFCNSSAMNPAGWFRTGTSLFMFILHFYWFYLRACPNSFWAVSFYWTTLTPWIHTNHAPLDPRAMKQTGKQSWSWVWAMSPGHKQYFLTYLAQGLGRVGKEYLKTSAASVLSNMSEMQIFSNLALCEFSTV